MTDAILFNFFRNIFNMYVVFSSCFFFSRMKFNLLLSIDFEIIERKKHITITAQKDQENYNRK